MKSLTVVSETSQYVIVNKPSFLDTQNSRVGRPSIAQWLLDHYGFAGIVHRLDFGVSGLLLCAKNKEAAKIYTDFLKQGKIKRIYIAVALGRVLPKKGSYHFLLDEKNALTHYCVLEYFSNATLLEVELSTGRKHQIRRHFSLAGHPLLGDHLHGKKGAKLLFQRPALHAHLLIVDGKKFAVSLPADMCSLISRLKERG